MDEHVHSNKASEDVRKAEAKMVEAEQEMSGDYHRGPEGSVAVKESVTLVVSDANEAEERLGQKSTWKTCLSPPSLPPRVLSPAARQVPTTALPTALGSPTTLSKRKKTHTPTPIVLLGLILGSILLHFTFPWEKEQSSVLPDQEQRKLGDSGSYNVLEMLLAIFALISEFLRLL